MSSAVERLSDSTQGHLATTLRRRQTVIITGTVWCDVLFGEAPILEGCTDSPDVVGGSVLDRVTSLTDPPVPECGDRLAQPHQVPPAWRTDPISPRSGDPRRCFGNGRRHRSNTKQTGSISKQEYRGRLLAAEKAGLRVRETPNLQVLWIGG